MAVSFLYLGILCTAAWADVAECVQKPCLRHAFLSWNMFKLDTETLRPSTTLQQQKITGNYETHLKVFDMYVL